MRLTERHQKLKKPNIHMKISYRPEIDGLRTIAVLSVILYHAEFLTNGSNILPGGFLGVDIFFVISGFLITSLIMKELQTTGTISILNFYERRARRLIPTLLLVMLISLPFAWIYYLPTQLVDYANSIISSIFFGSNFYWNYSLQQYGAESTLVKPFLHTWSLAVEEQYYIIYPLILLGIYKREKSHTIALLTTGILFSFCFAEWITPKDISFSFYMLPSRLWELLSGGLLAIIIYLHPRNNNCAFLNQTMPTLGLSLIIYSVLAVDFNNSTHPGHVTLLPVIGTILIIWFASEKELVTKMLSSRIFVSLGIISYSLYLWHYPIFSFGRTIIEDPKFSHKFSWILLTLSLSVASYFLVEKRFRTPARTSRKLFTITASITTLFILSIAAGLILNQGHPKRLGYLNELKQESTRIWVTKDGKKCSFGGSGQNPALGLSESCVFDSAGNSNRIIILIGDSHAGSLANDIKRLSEQNGYGFVQITMAGCSHITGINDKGKCGERSRKLASYLEQYIKPVIIYNSRIPFYIEMKKFINPEGGKESNYKPVNEKTIKQLKPKRISSVIDTLTEISRKSERLVIVYPVPEQGFHVRDKLFSIRPAPISKSDLPNITTSYAAFKERTKDSYSALDKVRQDNVIRIYPAEVFCNESTGRCMVTEANRLYYWIDNHVSPLGSELIVTRISRKLGMRFNDTE